MKKTVVLGTLVLASLLTAPHKSVAASTDKYDWQELNSNTVTTASMTHDLTTYDRYAQTQDDRWGKVEGTRTALKEGGSTFGYVRIRFEGLFGNPIEKTQSDREWGYGYSEAETPEPFNGLAYLRAYCGE